MGYFHPNLDWKDGKSSFENYFSEFFLRFTDFRGDAGVIVLILGLGH